MLDDNTTIKIVLAFAATVLWIFTVMRRGPDLSVRGADTWSMETFGFWWIARALVILTIIALGIGLAFGGKGSFAGALVLFCFSAATALVGFCRSRI
ncbi:hypothetical protein JQ633_28025 [Bradyrhizobium tropiciagri]|uniref:hypothetical protein n=1 Tax=Bradyrhizobium tropiciagri TaxID=312253 RepID=UPI001BA73038|nr:hypothetical protein [Bradyrhizobium tropiciagri]MBR0874239.1 hypothetical protein [Bradyrhizobium tropiciagri]